MDRRTFLGTGLGAAAITLLSACGVLPQSAPAVTRLPRLGCLILGSGTSSQQGLIDGLAELGYVEPRSIAIEWRLASSNDQFPAMAAELVGMSVDVILAGGSAPLAAAMSATSTIPIVFPVAGDPVAQGIAASLARPGGNVTGLTDLAAQLQGKRLQLLREMAPNFSRLLALVDRASQEAVGFQNLRAIQEAAQSLAIEVFSPDIRTPADISAAFEVATRERVEAVLVADTNLLTGRAAAIAELAIAARLPMITQNATIPRAGGLSGYGANIPALYRRSATFIDKILRGANPAEIPIEQAATFDFVINLKTAQALGISMPPSLTVQATELIQ